VSSERDLICCKTASKQRIAVVVAYWPRVLARSQPPYGTTEHATAATLEWAKAAGGMVASVAAFWAGRLCLCICNGRTRILIYR